MEKMKPLRESHLGAGPSILCVHSNYPFLPITMAKYNNISAHASHTMIRCMFNKQVDKIGAS